MVGVDMVFLQLRSKGWKLSISPACLRKAAFGGISGFPRDFSTGRVNRDSGFDLKYSNGCRQRTVSVVSPINLAQNNVQLPTLHLFPIFKP